MKKHSPMCPSVTTVLIPSDKEDLESLCECDAVDCDECDICKWRSNEIGYASKCPKHQRNKDTAQRVMTFLNYKISFLWGYPLYDASQRCMTTFYGIKINLLKGYMKKITLNPAGVPRRYPEDGLIVEPRTNYGWRQFCLALGFEVPPPDPADIEQPPLTAPSKDN